jgi:Heparinase II/III-like protein/Heparinase II/III N-terminus
LLGQIEHMERHRSTWFSPNTHLTGEALALFITAHAWPTLPRAGQRGELGFRILCEQALIQHRPDGSYFEQTTWYQAYTVAIFVEFLRWARAAGRPVPVPVQSRIHEAARALRAFVRPDGTIPLIGDDDGGRLLPLGTPAPADMSDVLCRAAVWFDDAALLTPGGAGRWSIAWLSEPDDWDRLVRLERAPLQARPLPTTVLRDGGWVIMSEHSAGDPTHGHQLVFDAGPHGALSSGHAHADALSVNLSVHGVDVIVDPGTGAYADPLRRQYRSTSEHATVTVDRTDSSQQGSAFGSTIANTVLLGAAHTPLVSWADAWHDGYERLPDPVRHRRTIGRLTGRYWIVLDSLSCTASHHVSITFPAASGTLVTTSPDHRQHAFARGGVTAHITPDPRLASTIEARQVSPAYGVQRASSALVSGMVIDGPVTFCTILSADDECGPVSVEIIGERCWQVTHRRGTDVVAAPRGDVLTLDGVAFDGAWMALVRETVPSGGREFALACGAGTLTIGTRSMPLAADDTVCLNRDGSGWTTHEDA